MAASELTADQIFHYLKEKGGKVANREAVAYFKPFLTDPRTKDDARSKFKKYVNTLAHSRQEGPDKYLYLKSKYLDMASAPVINVVASPQYDPRNALGIPLSPAGDFVSPRGSPRVPPPYRPPPPVSSPSPSMDSLISCNSYQDYTPQAPPRRRHSVRSTGSQDSLLSTPKKGLVEDNKEAISVKERTQKFNRLASVEDEQSPKSKSAEKPRKKGADEDDGAVDKPVEQKKCVEWYVTASKGDLQELLKLAKSEPRLVNKKDPFSNVLHWGAKYGNSEIIKTFAGTYKVDVNSKTGYTPLHISAQFGHKHLFKLLIESYKADQKIRDYSGHTPDYYFSMEKKGNKIGIAPSTKNKCRKKPSDKDLGFLRIGSLNVRVKKTTEAFSNFLGVGGSSINPLENNAEKVHKGWGSADNLNKDGGIMMAPKGTAPKKKTKRTYDGNPTISSPNPISTPPPKTHQMRVVSNDSDSDSAAGFDGYWKN